MHVSCHGIKDARGRLYLAAADTEMDLLDATAISAAWLEEQMSHSPSRHKLLLLDCCFSGKFPFNAIARAGDSVDVQERLQGRGRAIITASNAMEYSYEGDHLSGEGQPSHFTAAVVRALETGEADRDQDHWITVDELYEYVFDRVQEASPEQTPSKQIALEGPLYVARSRYQIPVEPAELDEHLLALIENTIAGARYGAVGELERLLTSSSPGVVLAVRRVLERMRDDHDSISVRERAEEVLAESSRRETEGQERSVREAEDAYRAAIAAGDAADGWFNLGLLLSEQEGRAPEAEEPFRASIAAGKTKGWIKLGNLLGEHLDRPREAEEAYRAAIAAGDTDAWNNLGNLLTDQAGRASEAEDAYRAAIAAGDTDARNNLGNLLSDRAGRAREAEEAYRAAIAAGDTGAWNNLGNLLSDRAARAREAEDAYRAAIAAGDTAKGWYNLGLLLSYQEGREQEAEEAYRTAIAAGNTDSWYFLGDLLSEQEGREKEAEEAYRAAIAAGDTDAWSKLGELLAKQEARGQEAENAFARAAEAKQS